MRPNYWKTVIFLLLISNFIVEVFGAFHLDKDWQEWKKKHHATYKTSAEEKKRYEAYKQNRMLVFQNNILRSESATFTMELNDFADMTPEEIATKVLTYRVPRKKRKLANHWESGKLKDEDYDDEFDKIPVQKVENEETTVGTTEVPSWNLSTPAEKRYNLKPKRFTVINFRPHGRTTLTNQAKTTMTIFSRLMGTTYVTPYYKATNTTARMMGTTFVPAFIFIAQNATFRAATTTTTTTTVAPTTTTRVPPPSIDWRMYGAVTPVRIQTKNCGACWTFSTTGAVEGRLKIKTGQLIPLSQQHLLDCTGGGNDCGGGYMTNAMKYIRDVGGLVTEADYPYRAAKSSCRFNKDSGDRRFGQLNGERPFEVVPPNDDRALIEALQTGPVTGAVDASRPSFLFYRGGIYNDPSCKQKMNHAILIVGYGIDDRSGRPYWLIKNSWGAGWGEQGYVRMARGTNICGLQNDLAYPNLV